MAEKKETYNWAQASFDLVSCESDRLADMLSAARLDPVRGDIAHIDLRGLDLSGQDMRGWDMRYALFRKANLAGADLRGAKFNPTELARSVGWKEAKLDVSQFREVEVAAFEALLDRRMIDVGQEAVLERAKHLYFEFARYDRGNQKAFMMEMRAWYSMMKVFFENSDVLRVARNHLFHEGIDIANFEIFQHAIVRPGHAKQLYPPFIFDEQKVSEVLNTTFTPQHLEGMDLEAFLLIAAIVANSVPSHYSLERSFFPLFEAFRFPLPRTSILGVKLKKLRKLMAEKRKKHSTR